MKDPLTRLATLATLSPKGARVEIPVINPLPQGGEGARGTRAGEGANSSLYYARLSTSCPNGTLKNLNRPFQAQIPNILLNLRIRRWVQNHVRDVGDDVFKGVPRGTGELLPFRG